MVPEAESEDAPLFGPEVVAELLNCIRGRKTVYCIDRHVAQVSAATRIYAELKGATP
ncbi:MAG: hypothetical protein RXO32_10490 [Thermoproteus sp.]